MNNKIPIITKANNKLTLAEERIIDLLNSWEEKIFKLTISQLAKKCFCSDPTITRLIKKIGYSSYKDFVIHFNYDLVKINSQYSVHEEKDENGIINNVKELSKFAVENYFSEINIAEFNKAIEIIFNSNKIFCFGLGSSAAAAEDLSNNLAKAGFASSSLRDIHSVLPIITNYNIKDSLIIFSNRASHKEVEFLIRLAYDNNTKVILISSNSEPSFKTKINALILHKNIHRKNRIAAQTSKLSQTMIADSIFRIIVLSNIEIQKKIKKSRLAIDRWENYSKSTR